ncbi:hypothetical protein [Desulfolutivibrio sulfoxidireducens]|uniref:hypothetical protein n=1 Tax=Desulfolutivibrio sulfoxidireducens TaxID=2773299 RepID=UPI00159D6296|nr:hypothetical protein [Desulfolutivibrio sulfoxidireducens]QLA18952.1 hypothetical protein GD604_03980 [Desulfolutivibrio sulfoxidireducens]
MDEKGLAPVLFSLHDYSEAVSWCGPWQRGLEKDGKRLISLDLGKFDGINSKTKGGRACQRRLASRPKWFGR